MIDACTATAGLSLGEYTALVFAGALSFEDALQVAKVRGEAMQAASSKSSSGMLSVVGLKDQILEDLCQRAIDSAMKEKKTEKGLETTGYVCQIANYNFPTGRVIAGHKTCLSKVVTYAREAGATKVQSLDVAGGFHTKLMASAQNALEQVLKNITIKQPKIAVYSNVTGKPYQSPEEIRTALALQLTTPVQFEKTLMALDKKGYKEVVTLGNRHTLAAIARRCKSTFKTRIIATQTQKQEG